MKSAVHWKVRVFYTDFPGSSLRNGFLFFFSAPADFSNIDRVFQYVFDGADRPFFRSLWFYAHFIQFSADAQASQRFPGTIRLFFSEKKEMENQTDDFCLLWHNLQGITFSSRYFYPFVTIGSSAGNPFAFLKGGHTSSLNAAVYGFVFSSAHEKSEFKVFFIVFVGGVIYFQRSQNQCVRNLKISGYGSLVAGIPSCQTFHFCHQNTVTASVTDVLQQFPDNGPVLNGFSGNNFPVKF